MNTQFLKMALGGTLLMDLGRMLLRVIITLVLTGAYMHYLFEINNVWLNIAWLLIVTAAAALTTLREARIGGLKLWLPLTAGMGAGIVVAGLLFLACAGLLRQLPDARCIVPVAGLLIATMTATCMKGMGSYHRSLAEDISKYNFLIGNGATHGEAIAPFVCKALESGLRPMTEGTAIMQLVTMPAMMGMILGGYPPVTAMKCQLMILIAAILSSVVAISLTIWLADNILFDNFGRRRNIKAMGLGVALMLTVVALTACNNGTAHRPLIGGDISENSIIGGATSETSIIVADEKHNEKEIASSAISIAGIELPKYDTKATVLRRAGYTTEYDASNKIPRWVAWCLTSNHVTGSYKRDGKKFMEDEDVPAPRATHFDYIQSGYDRGHMCPSGDCKWSELAQEQSFLLTNICPQNPNLNRGDWNELEQQCRAWAEKYGAVYIVCGPVLMNSRHKRIGKNKVTVPEAFFKVVLRMEPEPCAIGFIYRNTDGDRPKDSYVNSVDQVERITKLDFFHNLPDEIENKIEKTADIQQW